MIKILARVTPHLWEKQKHKKEKEKRKEAINKEQFTVVKQNDRSCLTTRDTYKQVDKMCKFKK